MSRSIFTAALLVALGALNPGVAEETPPPKPASPAAEKPDVTGKWTGTWGPYDPAKGTALEREKCKQLDCTVVLNPRTQTWEATFEGECGRPYKYVIKMDGRQADTSVLFKGTADLGQNDGGVYDWVGRATATEFAGFYTSARYIGVFRLTKEPPPDASAQP